MAIKGYSQTILDSMHLELDWLDGDPVLDRTVEVINDNSWYVFFGYNSGNGTQDRFWIFFFIDESEKTQFISIHKQVLSKRNFFAASIALCAMLAVWLLKQPSQIAHSNISTNFQLTR